ncbi:hypothetical protein COSO111634_14960 [Corallococcus soli]
MAGSPRCTSAADTTRFVDVPNSSTVPPIMEAYARGISTLLRGTFARWAAPMATGRKAAVVTVLEMKEENTATTPIIASTNAW